MPFYEIELDDMEIAILKRLKSINNDSDVERELALLVTESIDQIVKELCETQSEQPIKH